MYIYMVAKYLPFNQVEECGFVLELILYILVMSLIFSVSKKVWNWLREYNYTKKAQESQDFYINPAKTFNEDNCPICMCKPTKEVKTNCGHIFCGLCFQQFFTVTQTGPNRYKCPLCRRTVSNLELFSKVDEQAISRKTTDDKKIENFLKEYQWQFTRHKQHSIQIQNLPPWMMGVLIGSLLFLTVISPILFTSVKRLLDSYNFLPNYSLPFGYDLPFIDDPPDPNDP